MHSLMKLGLKVWSATSRFAIRTNRRTVLDRFGLARLTVTSSCSLVLAKLSSVLNIYVITYMELRRHVELQCGLQISSTKVADLQQYALIYLTSSGT